MLTMCRFYLREAVLIYFVDTKGWKYTNQWFSLLC